MGSFPGLLKVHTEALTYPYEAMHRLSLSHGPVMSVGLGPEVWVVLSGLGPIKEFWCQFHQHFTHDFFL
jgi:hypothetical protein